MLRVVFLGFFLIVLSMSSVFAAPGNVRLRPGEHDDYARLVFDWGRRVNYTVNAPSPDRLIVKFDTDASLDDSAFKAAPPKNISAVKILSTAPLEVELIFASGATTRDFSAETKVVIDVYDPPGATKAEKKVDAVKSEPKKIAAAPVTEVVKQPIASVQPMGSPGVEDLKKLQQAVATDLKTGLPAKTEKPNIIVLTATTSTGLAVFERAGRIWMVSDQENLVMQPNVTGPQAAQMMPPIEVGIQGGKAFSFPKLGARAVQGQAGGLVWRVVVAPQDIFLNAILPKREDDNADEPAGGKLIWDMVSPGRVLDVPDPVSGKMLKVVTVGSAKYMAGLAQDYVEFETMMSPVGLAILPKVDDLTVEITRRGVVVTRPGGLSLMSQKDIDLTRSLNKADAKKTEEKKLPAKRVFDFNSWQMGGIDVLEENRNNVLSTLGEKEPAEQAEGLISLARMHLANGMWAEASGFLDFAIEQVPELEQNPEYHALNGAARALGNISDTAFEDLEDKQLLGYPEIGYWKAYALADLQDWQQAGTVLPPDTEILSYYPEVLISRLGLVLAEVALRAGRKEQADKILKLVETRGGTLVFQQQAALEYLKGEAVRQKGKPDEALNIWKPLTTGRDAMYRARAGLAITRLQYERKKITAKEAIDSLERLRYAWRGDELEALINYWLGKVYFDTGQYIKGLNIMRDAATFSEGTDLGNRIGEEMVETFTNLFTGEELKKISGPDAAALYDEFSVLIPSGEKGNLVGEKLADHLVGRLLYGRAISILKAQMDHLTGAEAFRIAMKLAAIELMDGKSIDALSTLGKGKGILESLPDDQKTPERFQEMILLRARALSQERRPDQALALLHDMPRSKDVNKLRADIAWRAGYWDDAAAAMGDVINDENISPTRPLSAEHTGLLMQRAVALNLASDGVGLSNMREKYSDAMAQTEKARIFEVITRARKSGALADRKTLMGIVSEVDLFKDFLDGYKAESAPKAEKAPVPAAAK